MVHTADPQRHRDSGRWWSQRYMGHGTATSTSQREVLRAAAAARQRWAAERHPPEVFIHQGWSSRSKHGARKPSWFDPMEGSHGGVRGSTRTLDEIARRDLRKGPYQRWVRVITRSPDDDDIVIKVHLTRECEVAWLIMSEFGCEGSPSRQGGLHLLRGASWYRHHGEASAREGRQERQTIDPM